MTIWAKGSIAPLIREQLEQNARSYVKFTVVDTPEKWVAFAAGLVMAAYPSVTSPKTAFETIVSREVPEIRMWIEPKGIDVAFSKADLGDIALWIEQYFIYCLGCLPGRYKLQTYVERIP